MGRRRQHSQEKSYNVLIVQNPTKSLADDVAVTKSAIDSLNSEVVLVGHSYGGVVITEAGTHPRVGHEIEHGYGHPADQKRSDFTCHQ